MSPVQVALASGPSIQYRVKCCQHRKFLGTAVWGCTNTERFETVYLKQHCRHHQHLIVADGVVPQGTPSNTAQAAPIKPSIYSVSPFQTSN
eukprot:2158-Heterococcus_DN1.PRE.1